MSTHEQITGLLTATLNLGERGKQLQPESPLLGSLPELDSMAVLQIVAALEERFGIAVADEDISAATFETVASLTAYVEGKLAQ